MRIAATANLLAAVLAVEVSENFLTAVSLFIVGTATGIVGWALVLLVRLSNITARQEAMLEDHERRLSRLEK